MKKRIPLLFFICFFSVYAEADIRFTSNLLLIFERQEFPQVPIPRESVDRYRVRWRPGLLFLIHPDFEIGVEAVANGIEESDENVQPPRFPEFHNPLFDRDNFRRNKIVLSRAFARYAPSPAFELIGGKFENPFLVTPMVWDRDELHPNGGVVTVSYASEDEAVRWTGRFADFYATQYYGDRTNLIAAQGILQLSAGLSRLIFSGAYYNHDVKDLAVQLFRTNTRSGGSLANDYNLVDLIARIRLSFRIPVIGQFNYVKNTAADVFQPNQPGNGDQGYLAEIVIGQIQQPRDFRIGFTHHHVESDAVLAAYNTDQWWFPTRGEGYRIHGSFMAWKSLILHASYLNQTLIDQDNEFKRWQFSAEIPWP
jgi:Putative porin